MFVVSKKKEEKLAHLVREFFATHPDVKLVAITGSAGKASAKIAIGTVLSQQFNIQLSEEEPKTKADVFLQIMGIRAPQKKLFAWWKVKRAMKKRIKAKNPEIQVIVQEFNPQELGYNVWFRDYLVPDVAVLTSVTNGRMQVEYTVLLRRTRDS